MKTKEFIKKVEELGFEYEKAAEVYFIYDKEGTKYASVCHTTSNQISNMERAWDGIDKDVQEKLFYLLIEYAKTPIEDRGEEKKFLIQHKYLVSIGSNPVNLVKYKDKNNYRAIRCLLDNQFYQAQFTLKEIEEIKEKFDTDLNDFELVEVADD